MELYIYDCDTLEIIDTVTGADNNDCESQAADIMRDEGYERHRYGWTYTDQGLR